MGNKSGTGHMDTPKDIFDIMAMTGYVCTHLRRTEIRQKTSGYGGGGVFGVELPNSNEVMELGHCTLLGRGNVH